MVSAMGCPAWRSSKLLRARMPYDHKDVARLVAQFTKVIQAAHRVTVNVTFKAEYIETVNAPEPLHAVMYAARVF